MPATNTLARPMEEISNVIIKFAYVPVLITATYAALIYKKLPHELKLISWFIFLSAIVQAISAILWYNSMNNLWVLHLFVGIGFLLLAMFYNAILDGFINKRVIRVTTILFLLFTIINAAYIQGIYRYASNSLTVESILIIILSLSTFILLLDDIVKESKGRIVKSLNWINSGLFLYYASSLLLFYFGEYIIQGFSKSASVYTWVLHFLFLTVMHTCFFIGLWNRSRS